MPACEQAAAACRPGGPQLTRRLVSCGGLARGARVLDVGCGAGDTVRLLREEYHLDAFGVDPLATPSPYIQVAAAEHLPFGDAHFDAVLCECSFSLVEDPAQALAEFSRVLRPSGRLLLTDLYSRTTRARFDGALGWFYTRADFEDLLRGHGYRLCAFEDHTDALKQYVAQCIMDSDNPPGTLPWAGHAALKPVKPGYCLLAATR